MANFKASQNALSTSAEAAASADPMRHRLTILNIDTGITIYIGNSDSVDSATGFPLAAGAAFTFEGSSARATVYAIAASGTPSIAILEEFD